MAIQKVVLMVAVFRTFVKEGARLASVRVLNENAGAWNNFYEAFHHDQADWTDLMEEACRSDVLTYWPPDMPFEVKDDDEEKEAMLTMLHPIVLEGASAAALAAVRELLNGNEQYHVGEVLRAVGRVCDIAAAAETDTMADILGEILNQFVRLNIPRVIPYGKCELDYARVPVSS